MIRAVVVTVTDYPDGWGGVLQGENPDIPLPDFGNVAFLCRIGRNGRAWTRDFPVKGERIVIPCDFPGGALRVAGTPRPGVSWTLTPVYYQEIEGLGAGL